MVQKRKEMQEELGKAQALLVPKLVAGGEEDDEMGDDYEEVVAGHRGYAHDDSAPHVKVGKSIDRQNRLEKFQEKLEENEREARKLAAEFLEMAAYLQGRHSELGWAIGRESQERKHWAVEVRQEEGVSGSEADVSEVGDTFVSADEGLHRGAKRRKKKDPLQGISSGKLAQKMLEVVLPKSELAKELRAVCTKWDGFVRREGDVTPPGDIHRAMDEVAAQKDAACRSLVEVQLQMGEMQRRLQQLEQVAEPTVEEQIIKVRDQLEKEVLSGAEDKQKTLDSLRGAVHLVEGQRQKAEGQLAGDKVGTALEGEMCGKKDRDAGPYGKG